jgi:hypothetical protein
VAERRGDLEHGFSLPDEAMLPVLAGELRPEDAGLVYCEMIEGPEPHERARRHPGRLAASDGWAASSGSSQEVLHDERGGRGGALDEPEEGAEVSGGSEAGDV